MRISSAVEAIRGLRAAVAGAARAEDEDVHRQCASPAFAECQITRVPNEDAIAHVAVQLVEPLTLSDLEEAFGQARRLPARPEGGSSRSVLFERTLPAEGSTGATLLAEVEEDGFVRRLVIRRDVL
ncbi:MAG TPA: hypothetical protein VNN21_00620 [Dehalococcoidia bacterium]|nr:hypothetical protein [Dehalococcoidia bacterium]